MKSFHITIKGRVQDVGFRYFTLNKALKYMIKGTVENNKKTKDVEIYCQGEKNNIGDFLKEIKKGPALSFISKFNFHEIPNQNFPDFRIL